MKKICVAIIFLIYLIGCGANEKSVDLSNFTEVSFKGMEGKGTASISFSIPDFEKIAFTPEDMNKPDIFTKAAEIEESIKYSVNPSENLSNGDTVTVIITWDNDVAKKYKLALSQSVKTITVKDLKIPQEIDVFQDVKVEFEGISPYAKITVSNESSNDFAKTVTFEPDIGSGISNGDTIIITAKYDESEAENAGYKITKKEKSFVAAGIDEYISKVSQIDNTTMAEMKKIITEKIEKLFADRYLTKATLYPAIIRSGDYAENLEVFSTELSNAYLLSNKQRTGFVSSYNKLYLVYRIEFKTSWTPKNNESEIVYIPYSFENVILRNNGDIDVKIEDITAYSSDNSIENLHDIIAVKNENEYNCDIVEY